ncbi:hypothetical protein PM082_012368 [Marasmius tenuissimus]|nr:hypothetical protein PM082_012368 [Marasmius tenuissimus]
MIAAVKGRRSHWKYENKVDAILIGTTAFQVSFVATNSVFTQLYLRSDPNWSSEGHGRGSTSRILLSLPNLLEFGGKDTKRQAIVLDSEEYAPLPRPRPAFCLIPKGLSKEPCTSLLSTHLLLTSVYSLPVLPLRAQVDHNHLECWFKIGSTIKIASTSNGRERKSATRSVVV